MKNIKVSIIIILIFVIYNPINIGCQTNKSIIKKSNSINIYDYPEVIEKANKFSLFLREFNKNTDVYILHRFVEKELESIIRGNLKYDFFNYYDYKGLSLNQFLKRVDSLYGKSNLIDSSISFYFDENEAASQLSFNLYYKSNDNFVLELHITFSEECYEILGKKNKRKFNKDNIYDCNKFDFIAFLKKYDILYNEIKESPFLFSKKGRKKTLLTKFEKMYGIK